MADSANKQTKFAQSTRCGCHYFARIISQLNELEWEQLDELSPRRAFK